MCDKCIFHLENSLEPSVLFLFAMVGSVLLLNCSSFLLCQYDI